MFPLAFERSTPVPYPVKLTPVPLPLRPLRKIEPVVPPPIVRFLELVVWIEPCTLLNVIFPEVLALPDEPNIWKRAEEVDFPPLAQSLIVLEGAITLFANWKYPLTPPLTG